MKIINIAFDNSLRDVPLQKSRIRETPTLSPNADSRTNTNLKRLRDLSFFIFFSPDRLRANVFFLSFY